MKKAIAYLLIIIGLTNFIVTNIIIKSKLEKIKILNEMYESPKGIKVIVSDLSAKISGVELELVAGMLFLFLLVLAIIILFYERIQKIEAKLK